MSFPWAQQYEPKGPFTTWLDNRLPIPRLIHGALGPGYPVPRNLNYFWNFGVLAGLALVLQIVTGVILAMHYRPEETVAFQSVEHIMRNVNHGWFLRYAHANGASFFFIAIYIHMGRNLYYGSYKAPREMVFLLGLVIFLLAMATAFMGYVLPWGQMSFWGAQVITGLLGAIPFVGESIQTWLLGGFAPGGPTLNRFLSLHYLLPFVIMGVVMLHIWALHIPGSGNPTGVDVKSPQDTVPFHPYYTAKDGFGVGVYFILFSIMLFFLPNYLGHPDNYIPANPLSTPAHITPEWYFWPFYAILRAFTVDFILEAKLWGVIAMFSAILVLFLLPWLDTSPVRSANYRPMYRMFFFIWLFAVLILGWCGGLPAEEPYVMISQIATAYYFAFFLIIVPVLSKIEKTRPLPNSISTAVLGENYEASPIGMETGTPSDQARGEHRPGGAHGGAAPQPAE